MYEERYGETKSEPTSTEPASTEPTTSPDSVPGGTDDGNLANTEGDGGMSGVNSTEGDGTGDGAQGE